MLTTTHLALALMIGLLLNLNRDEWFIALSFGVVIDVDHLFAAPRYIGDNGIAAILRPSWDDGSGLPWKSLMHYPIGAFVMIPLSIGWRYLVPLLFWGMHVAVDQLQAYIVAWNTPIEIAVIAGSGLGIVAVAFSRWRCEVPDGDFRTFLRAGRLALSTSLAAFSRSVRGRSRSSE